MRALLVVAAAALATASAQTVVNPDRLPVRWRSFEKPASDQRLQCRVRSIAPRLNYGFRFQTGFLVEVPMRQYSGPGHRWSVVLRVTPKDAGHEPVWFLSRLRIPPVADTKASGEFGGSYLVGEGEYRVDMLLIDDQNRACVDDWTIRAKLDDKVRDVKPGLAAGVVDDISLRRWRRMVPTDTAERRYNLAVLLHASAMLPGRTHLRGYDRMMLMSALSSMIERLPVRNVRLTLFSMDKQQEIYHTPDLSIETFREAMDALNRVELGTVDYGTLANRTGHLDLVADLLNRELAAQEPPDAVVFLGPVARYGNRVDDPALRERIGNTPVYYAQLRPFRLAFGILPDTIMQTVRRLGGKTKEVYSPEQFAAAIQDIERLLGGTRSRRSGIAGPEEARAARR